MPYSLEHQQAPYLKYDLLVNYHWHSGKLPLPVAYHTGSGVGASQEVCRVHKARGVKVVTFDIERLGRPPEIPAAETADENEELIEASVNPLPVTLDAEGRIKRYRVSGRYVYSCSRPVFVTEASWPKIPPIAQAQEAPLRAVTTSP